MKQDENRTNRFKFSFVSCT